ncbi:hypothetical protein [Microbacterium resistens]|uniref:Uncharacterized protein n=1 Tax=Microbacterium resistens TaxID=156977 RepID=A0ABY3RP04_9MICO|nr:hypothetical protein [Microbacterium resistens]MBW1639670.1 hypothetical protein [Microbacterium resistens]UGS25713.1 hypothetical protein K8F61_13715 [Microbacterium resistens]
MTGPTDYSTQARVQRINEDFARRRSRFFLGFAIVEGLLLAAAVVVVYVLEVVDPDQGFWIIAAVAALGGMVMAGWIVSSTRAQQQAIRDVGGTIGPPAA